jgi:hypothetical protein
MTRQIEMLRCWGDNTWDTAFQDIPVETPEGDIDIVAIDAHISELVQAKKDVAHVAVYHIPEVEETADLHADDDEGNM